jgi:flagellin-like protein
MGKRKPNRKFIEADERAVSAVIGVILMVAITVAIAATVYVYVSGMLPSSSSTTPTVSMTADPVGHNCMISIATTTPSSVQWSSVWYTLTDITNTKQISNGTVAGTSTATIIVPRTGQVQGGQIITIKAAGTWASGNPLDTNTMYRLTLVYNVTKGSMGTVTWTQP